MNQKNKKLSHEEFYLMAIKALQKPPYLGIHTVWSGFNDAFREYFPGEDPVKVTKRLTKQGKIVAIPARGGVRIYLLDETPGRGKETHDRKKAREVLNKMGLE
jgi:hypothetical protein